MTSAAPGAAAAAWWMRGVGALYLIMFAAAAIVRLPIRVLAPEGVLERAAAGDGTARLLVDTWVTLGLEFAVVGAALLIASRSPGRATALAWFAIALEVIRGIGTDVYMIARGHEVAPHVAWIAIHVVVIATGVAWLRRGAIGARDIADRSATRRPAASGA
jgi:hypothetical protein